MHCPILQACQEDPQRVLFRDSQRNTTAKEFGDMVHSAEMMLERAGLVAGDRMVLQHCADLSFFALIFAAIRRQIVSCPLSPRLTEAQFSARCDDLCPRLVIRKSVREELEKEWSSAAKCRGGEERSFDDEAMAFILFTSGSSGNPKGACLTFKNLWLNAKGALEGFPYDAGDCWLLSLPLHHVGGWGIVFRALLGGGSVFLLSEGERPADHLLRVTHVSCVPTQLGQWMAEAMELRHLKGILIGGAAPGMSLMQAAGRQKLRLFRTYGCTEMGSQVTRTRQDASIQELLSEGMLLPYREMKLDGQGSIFVRGETLFLGYWDRHEIRSPLVDGWYATGDRGVYREGLLYFAGRVDNLIISGGENIQPEEIEAALKQIPLIEDAIVVAKEDPRWGQRPVAFVRTPGPFDVENWRQVLSQQLERFKLPDAFYPWPDCSQGDWKVSRRQIALQLTQQ